jgi:hydrogenase expression/formation protein HypE
MQKITLAHGSGGRLSQELINNVIYPIFKNNGGNELNDSALLSLKSETLAFTTDSYVVKPIFFPGGDIGKLAVCGTINDLSVCGAIPKYLSVGFIIEEGLEMRDLKTILKSMANVLEETDVKVVTGDTKVVERGNAEKIYINTSGIGIIPENVSLGPGMISADDVIIVSGTVGDHGMAILSSREGLSFESSLQSDCAPLNSLTRKLVETGGVTCMRDPTRGGLASCLVELANQAGCSMEVYSETIPINPLVKSGCDMLGLDPLYLANEGKVIIFVKKGFENNILTILKNHPLGKNAAVIGRVIRKDADAKVLLETELGVKRSLYLLEGEHLPRIC